MLDHVSLGVSDLDCSRRFYDAVLRRGSDYGAAPGTLGVEFTITREASPALTAGMHLCFRAPDQAAVSAFHAAALAAGGRDDGLPGLRTNYHPDDYSAFVLDPDGHCIEPVCHAPTAPAVI